MMTEAQLYMSASCQPGSRVIRAFSDVEQLFYFLIWRLKPPKQKIKGFSTSKKARISSRVSFIDTAAGGIVTSLIYIFYKIIVKIMGKVEAIKRTSSTNYFYAILSKILFKKWFIHRFCEVL